MLAAIHSASLAGVEARDITVEVHASRGLPHWTIVGLPAHAVKESKERVCAALSTAGFEVPARRITINLAPADLPKTGTAFDLPIALGVLVATGQLRDQGLQGAVVVGELGLDGSVRPVRGVLPMATHLRRAGGRRVLLVPPANAVEARLVEGLDVWVASSLRDLVAALREAPRSCAALLRLPPAGDPPTMDSDTLDLADVAGQPTAKRALEIAAAGGHALLLVGSPGAGKTMLARRLPSVLPALSADEALEVLAVHSVAGLLASQPSARTRRPFRAPHHSLSTAALIGGGSVPRPGEVSLAHHGVLFLDELQEMPRARLDALRQPLEDGRVLIARAQQSAWFPSEFSLVGAMNPCPCGYAGDPSRACVCPAADVIRHRGRVSGPLADRIDLMVQVPALPLARLRPEGAEPSAVVRARVEVARAQQLERFGKLPGVRCNARAGGRWIDAHTPIAPEARRLLVDSAERARLSARGFHRALKVARTIADLAADALIRTEHVGEALYFRSPERLPSPAGAA